MSALEQLVRLHGWTLDERRRKVADLEELAERLKSDLARLNGDLLREEKTASGSLELKAAFDAYAAIARKRRDRISSSIADVNAEIERAQGEVTDAFQELKRYEQALANRRTREAGKQRRREQAASDEIGIHIYRRSQAKGG